MTDWALAAAAALLVLALAAACSSLGALIDGRGVGSTVGSALLTPVTETARLLRQVGRGRGPGVRAVVLLGAALLAAAALPLGALQGGLVVVAVLLGVGVVCARLLVQEPGTSVRAGLADAGSIALPPVLAVAGPAVAGHGLRLVDAAAAQRDLWSAVTMPVALVALLAGAAAAVPRSPARLRTASGAPRLIAHAGRAALIAAAAAVSVPLFLGGGAGPLLPPWLWTAVKAAGVAAALTLALRLLPAPRTMPLVRAFRRVVLPLVLTQLAVVVLVGLA